MWFKRKHNEYGCPMCGRLPVMLIFKWNETQIPVSQILKLTAHKPLFGNKQPNRTGTHWIVFMKEDAK